MIKDIHASSAGQALRLARGCRELAEGISSRHLMPEEAAQMSYAPNLFDVEDYDVYRKYLMTAGSIVQELGGDLVVMGKTAPEVPVHFRGTTGCRAQRKLAGMRG